MNKPVYQKNAVLFGSDIEAAREVFRQKLGANADCMPFHHNEQKSTKLIMNYDSGQADFYYTIDFENVRGNGCFFGLLEWSIGLNVSGDVTSDEILFYNTGTHAFNDIYAPDVVYYSSGTSQTTILLRKKDIVLADLITINKFAGLSGKTPVVNDYGLKAIGFLGWKN